MAGVSIEINSPEEINTIAIESPRQHIPLAEKTTYSGMIDGTKISGKASSNWSTTSWSATR